MVYVLKINDEGRVVITDTTDRVTTPISTKDAYLDFLDNAANINIDLVVYCSSSIDFPEEHTNDPKTIELAKWFRAIN